MVRRAHHPMAPVMQAGTASRSFCCSPPAGRSAAGCPSSSRHRPPCGAHRYGSAAGVESIAPLDHGCTGLWCSTALAAHAAAHEVLFPGMGGCANQQLGWVCAQLREPCGRGVASGWLAQPPPSAMGSQPWAPRVVVRPAVPCRSDLGNQHGLAAGAGCEAGPIGTLPGRMPHTAPHLVEHPCLLQAAPANLASLVQRRPAQFPLASAARRVSAPRLGGALRRLHSKA